MSNRQYGIPSGYQEGSSGDRGIISPVESYNAMQTHQLRDIPTPAVARRPVAPYERKPVGSNAYGGQAPPPYQPDVRSYTPYRSQNSAPPEEESYGVAAGDGDLSEGGQRIVSPLSEQAYQSHYDQRPVHPSTDSQNSLAPLAVHGAEMAGRSQPASRMTRNGVSGYGYGYDQSMPGGVTAYQGDGYDEYMDPRNIADDDDGLDEPPRNRRSRFGGPGAVGGAAGASTGGASILKSFASRDASGNYGPVPGNGGSGGAEKSEWLTQQSSGRKRLKWIVGSIIAVVIIAAVVGIVVGVLLSRSSGGETRGSADDSNGIWDINSSQVQAVLNNDNLHKVFPGMDYTPLDAQYPACLSNPPFQNDVTLDVAVLAQMSPAIRLYGTDCKQTEMVLKGIDLLGYNDTMKVWLGVWLQSNQTTNTRQLNQMYDILDTYPSSHFAGVIVGNEVLYREDMTLSELTNELRTVKQKLTSRGIDLPVSTSDLGDDWNATLAANSDIVMSNVHPFFAGVTPEEAPGWTWSFWQENDVVLKGRSGVNYPTNIISETGWPSQGGNDCGNGKKCPTKTMGAIAGIDELNKFMEGWVCQSLANGTTYFWFEAFDEPWKVIFNTPKTGDYWEPHWGLMDVNRHLKDGVKIPDCGGKTIDKPY